MCAQGDSPLHIVMQEILSGPKANSFSHLDSTGNRDAGAVALWQKVKALGVMLQVESKKYATKLIVARNELCKQGVKSIFPGISSSTATLIDDRFKKIEAALAEMSKGMKDANRRISDVAAKAQGAHDKIDKMQNDRNSFERYCKRSIDDCATKLQDAERRRSEENRRHTTELQKLRDELANETQARAEGDAAVKSGAAQGDADVLLSLAAAEQRINEKHARSNAEQAAAVGALEADLEAERQARAEGDAAVESGAAQGDADVLLSLAVAEQRINEKHARSDAEQAAAVGALEADLEAERQARAEGDTAASAGAAVAMQTAFQAALDASGAARVRKPSTPRGLATRDPNTGRRAP